MSNPRFPARKYAADTTICLLLFGLSFLVFGSTLRAEFLPWDDDINIYQNPHLGPPTWERLHWMFTDLTYQWRYQPLSWLTWSIIYCFGQFAPFGYHLVNLIIHGLNAVFVYLVIRQLLQQVSALPETGPSAIRACSALAAAFWALHPLRVETVAWAVELLYNQAAFFCLWSFLCYLRAFKNGPSGSPRYGLYGLSVLLFALSLLSYPLAFGWIVVLLAADIYVTRRLPDSPRRWREKAVRMVWLEKIPFVLLTLLALAANLYARVYNTGRWGQPLTLAEFGLFPRLMQAFYVWAYMLWRPWWPSQLSPLYPQLVDFNPVSAPFLISALVVLGISAALFLNRRRWPLLFGLWVCHLGLLVPVLGLTEHPHFPSDRYSLLIGVGWALLVAGMLWRLWANPRRRTATVIGAAALLSLSSYASYRQTAIWQNSFTFFPALLHYLGDDPYAQFVHYRFGKEYLLAGQYDLAGKQFHQALPGVPHDPTIPFNLAVISYRLGNLPDALYYVREATRRNPRYLGAHEFTSRILAELGRYAEAEPEIRAELQLSPQNPLLLLNLGILCAEQGKIESATIAYRDATRPKPVQLPLEQRARFFRSLALAVGKTGDQAMAVKIATKGLDIAKQSGNVKLIYETQQCLTQLSTGGPTNP